MIIIKSYLRKIVFFTIMLSSLCTCGQVYKKTIYSTSTTNINDAHYSISIEATSSASFSLILDEFIYRNNKDYPSTTISLKIPPSYFNQIVGFFKKYVEWHDIASSSNIDLTKSIGILDVSNIMCIRENTLDFHGPDTTYNSGKMSFEYKNNSMYLTSGCFTEIYDYTSSKAVVNALTGINFDKLKKEIDDKIKLWDKFK